MNILLVDDQRVLLDTLSCFIEKALPHAKVFTAISGIAALQFLETNEKAEVVLLDVNMPVMSGVEVATKIVSKYPDTKIIMLTNVDGKSTLLNLAGIVHGFLLKGIYGTELIEAIKTVIEGKKYFCKESSKILIDGWQMADKIPDVYFNKREVEIVEHMASGKSGRQIAEIMNLKESIIT